MYDDRRADSQCPKTITVSKSKSKSIIVYLSFTVLVRVIFLSAALLNNVKVD